MTTPAILACLDRLVALWEQLPREMRPDGFWVVQHDRVDDFERSHTHPVIAAWYVDAQGIRPRMLDDFDRFHLIQTGSLWASESALFQTRAAFLSRARMGHAIGIARIGMTNEPEVIYLDYLWGGLEGQGLLFRFDADDQRLTLLRVAWIT
jgi:hypothetical protein